MIDAIELLRAILRIPSVNPPGDERPVAQYLHDVLRSRGIAADVVTFADNRANLVARLPGAEPGPGLVFAGHMDVVPVGQVPWEHDPFGADHANGRIYGRGAADMKSGLAAAVMALIELHDRGAQPPKDITVLGTAGEEAGCAGAKYLCANGYLENVGAIVIPEPTDNRIIHAHKGALWLSLTTTGKTAHASTPHLGINAVQAMLRLLGDVTSRLSAIFAEISDPVLGRPTWSVTRIEGGVKTNVIPDHCRAEIDMRTVPQQVHDDIAGQVELAARDVERSMPGLSIAVERINDLRGLYTSPDDPFVALISKVVAHVCQRPADLAGIHAYTDASILGPCTRAPVVVIGSASTDLAHQPDEYVEISAYLQSINLYKMIALSYS